MNDALNMGDHTIDFRAVRVPPPACRLIWTGLLQTRDYSRSNTLNKLRVYQLSFAQDFLQKKPLCSYLQVFLSHRSQVRFIESTISRNLSRPFRKSRCRSTSKPFFDCAFESANGAFLVVHANTFTVAHPEIELCQIARNVLFVHILVHANQTALEDWPSGP
jgi:hypothetical protein